MKITVISLFPKMFEAISNYGITKKAIEKKVLLLEILNLRDFSRDTDAPPYGGGPGMVILPHPLKKAICQAKKNMNRKCTVVYLTPHGRLLNYENIVHFNKKNLILVCGRYTGIDERIIVSEIDEEWSIGDYILSNGDLAAMVVIDTISRLIPGVLNNKLSCLEDSFVKNHMLSHPVYTYPRIFHNMKVPEVLLSGNHKKIKRWKLKYSLGFTWMKKPKLLNKINLNDTQKKLLNEFKNEFFNLKSFYEKYNYKN